MSWQYFTLEKKSENQISHIRLDDEVKKPLLNVFHEGEPVKKKEEEAWIS